VAGSHVTSEMVVATLRVLLPADLQILFSDPGKHFTADVFQQFAKEANFVHVVIARQRCQMELRNVLSVPLKEWLADKAWSSDHELLEFLGSFLMEYNDLTHQELPIPGLSPNEFAKRYWLL